MRTLEDVAKDIARILEELDIDYVIVGGIAVSGWGNVRTTRDVDIIMALREEDIDELVEALIEKNFSVTKRDIKEALKEKSHFTVFDKLSDYHIDAKGVYGEKEQRSIRTRKVVDLGGVNIYIASPEDTIANKLVFGSEQDMKDAEGIYVRQLESLDMEYLEEICRDMGVYEDFIKMKRRVESYLEKND